MNGLPKMGGLEPGGAAAGLLLTDRMAVDRPLGDQLKEDSNMHEFEVVATFLVIAAIYLGLFFAAEKFFMK